MTIRTYSSPAAFKQALDHRLRAETNHGGELTRRRQLLVFDRFLARVVSVLGDGATLKGGLVLELRLKRARATKDIDLRLAGSPNDILANLQTAGQRDLGDFMFFEVGIDQDHPKMQSEAMQYEGLRFRAECRIAGKLYGQPFGVDVAFGDPVIGEPEVVVADDFLAFAGIEPPTLRLYPVVTHIAEKLHAYTMPRSHPNTRVKDLPDLALLATTQVISAAQLRSALETTFSFRRTHPLPASVPTPPTTWAAPYIKMVREDQLAWVTLDEITQAVKSFLDPVLAGSQLTDWNPSTWTWSR
jgi:hypothetical protein